VGINAREEGKDMDCKPMYADTKTIEALGSAVDLNIEGDVELVVSDLMEEREEKEVLDW
jgi:hypothetical protein